MKAAATQLLPASVPRMTLTQIVCGDCAGDAVLPKQTFLMADGSCSRCGGRNFVLASTLCGALARHLSNGDSNERTDD